MVHGKPVGSFFNFSWYLYRKCAFNLRSTRSSCLANVSPPVVQVYVPLWRLRTSMTTSPISLVNTNSTPSGRTVRPLELSASTKCHVTDRDDSPIGVAELKQPALTAPLQLRCIATPCNTSVRVTWCPVNQQRPNYFKTSTRRLMTSHNCAWQSYEWSIFDCCRLYKIAL